MRRGGESRGVRRSVCGQDKMHPAIKECLNCQSGPGTVAGSIPLHQLLPPHHTDLSHTCMSVHTHTHTHTHTHIHTHTHTHHKQFPARFRATGGRMEEHGPSETAAAAAAKTVSPANGVCRVKPKRLIIPPEEPLHVILEAQQSAVPSHVSFPEHPSVILTPPAASWFSSLTAFHVHVCV